MIIIIIPVYPYANSVYMTSESIPGDDFDALKLNLRSELAKSGVQRPKVGKTTHETLDDFASYCSYTNSIYNPMNAFRRKKQRKSKFPHFLTRFCDSRPFQQSKYTVFD